MPTSKKSVQRVVTLALDVLHSATYAQTMEKGVDTIEMRLALAALWLIMNDRSKLTQFLEHAGRPKEKPWEGCRDSYYGICHDLRREGWWAPVDYETAKVNRPPWMEKLL